MIDRVVVSGRLDHLEVWNRDRLQKRFEEQTFSEEDFEYMAERSI